MQFKLKALGSLVVEGRDGPVVGSATQRRTLALLVLIAAARGRGVSRDKLIGLLWPETTDDRARHAFAQTLYRLRQEFGADAVEGSDTLRLNVTEFGVDVAEFEDAFARGELEPAAALYGGPFLDGFFLPGAPEFERWMEEERARLSAINRGLLERLAIEATRSGEPERAAEWWRSLAANEPLNSRVAARLVEARHAAGDRAGALEYARVHETLVRLELDTEPGSEFAAAVAASRADVARKGPSAPERSSPEPSVVTTIVGHEVTPDVLLHSPSAPSAFGHTSESFRVTIPRRAFRRAVLLLGVGVGVGAAAIAATSARFNTGGSAEVPLIAVGHIADYTGGDSAAAARLLPEMLTTNLSRLEGLAVVSRARLHELIPPQSERGPDAADFVRAAQQAGVHQLLDGALYRRPDGSLRLDLRVLDLRSGQVRQGYQTEGRDAFELADSATMAVASGFALSLPGTLRISDVTTTSAVAFRFYEEGLNAMRQNDPMAARRLFGAALTADSGFAMAAFGIFQASHDEEYLRRAVRLASRATDRERLIIRANWASVQNHPSQVAVAETLAARYPAEPESHILLANALFWHGDFAGALVISRQAFAMDSLTLRTSAPRCVACEALYISVIANIYLDSMAAAEAVARDWIARQPASPFAWGALRDVRSARDDTAGALAANERARATTAGPFDDFGWLASLSIRSGDFAKADRALVPLIHSLDPHVSQRALWWLAISQRHRGRLREALAATQRLQRSPSDNSALLHHGQVLLELGRHRESAVVFDSAVRKVRAMVGHEPSALARHEAWALMHKAGALSAAGDVGALHSLADSVQAIGAMSGYGRNRLLHHHIRGLLSVARGRKEEAITAFRNATWSPVGGYTRTNLELGRLLIEVGRPQAAIPVLRAALHGGLEASNLYVTHTEIHALLSRAFKATQQRDSAASHARWVERAMAGSDSFARMHIDRLLGNSSSASR